MPHFTKPSSTELYELTINFGDPLSNRGRIRPLHFSNYIALACKIIFVPEKNSFYAYEEADGIWHHLNDSELFNFFHQFLNWYDQVYQYAGTVDNATTTSSISSISKSLKGLVNKPGAFVRPDRYFFHLSNGVIQIDQKTGRWQKKEVNADFFSTTRSPLTFDPNCQCPRFLNELILPAMTPDDAEHLQLYLGQCLLGINLSQTFLLLEGTAGGGKSTLVNIIEKLIGREHCTELRTTHTTGRFETSSYLGKRLLTGKDVDSQFMNNSGARALKFLTGNDTVTTEYKNSNTRHNMECQFNVIITCNNTLRIKFDGDLEAWRRRILLIKYQNLPPVKKIPNFDDILIAEEGSGILNWILEGAEKLIQNNGVIPKSDVQKANIDQFLRSSDPFTYFADLYIHPTPQAAITSEEVVTQFTKFCHAKGWGILSDRDIQKQFKSYMAAKYGATQSHSINRNGKLKRGFYNFQIRNSK